MLTPQNRAASRSQLSVSSPISNHTGAQAAPDRSVKAHRFTGALFTFGMLLFSGALTANPEIPDYYSAPGLNPHRVYLNQTEAEHIDPFSGKLQLHYVDLFLPGNGGLDIKVSRSYTSRDSQDLQHSEKSPFGVGWSLHFGRIISPDPNAECGGLNPGWADDHPVLELADGSRQVLYTPAQDEAYFGGRVPDYVTTGLWKLDYLSSDQGFHAYSPDGTSYEFSTLIGLPAPGTDSDSVLKRSWYLSRITDRNGNWLEFSYLGDGPGSVSRTFPLINRISASDGRAVQFSYQGVGTHNPLLIKIEAYGQTWEYHYEEADVLGHYLLSAVVRPDASQWRYRYHPGPSGVVGAYNIVEVEHPLGGVSRYDYTENFFNADTTRTVSIKRRQVLDRAGVTPGTWTYSYLPGAYSQTPDRFDKTIVAGPDKTEVFLHYGIHNLLAHAGEAQNWKPAARADTGPTPIGTTWRPGPLDW